MRTPTTFNRPPARLPLYLRAALPHRGTTVPDRAYRLEGARPDVRHVSEYARLCGFAVRAALPLTYPHLLGFPLQMAVLAQRDFPFSATGLVHIGNRIEQRRAVGVHEPLDVEVRAAGPDAHPRGRTVDLHTTVSAAGEVVWTSSSTYLRRGPSDTVRPSTNLADVEVADDLPTTAVWRLPADLGRRYAAVSGDLNPIHLNRFAAKAFGFPRTIAHGMWSAAACAATLEGRLPDAVVYEVAFRAPVLLASTVELASRADRSGAELLLRSPSGRTHLRGRVTAAG